MLKQLKNIDQAFQHIKRFSLFLVLACVLISGFTIYISFNRVREIQDTVYVLSSGKVLEAVAASRKDNVAVEARDHIATFHHWFFTLDPDEKVIQANLSKALNLADESARRSYESLKERGFYSNLIAAHISQQIAIDSIQLSTDEHPYRFRCYATQKLVRSSATVTRKLVTQGELRNVSRSDHNPHGFLIQQWETLANEDVPTKFSQP
jgi:conjugative transposon TraK protein